MSDTDNTLQVFWWQVAFHITGVWHKKHPAMTFLPKDQVDESKLLPLEYANVKDSEELLQRRDVGEGVVEINNGHVGKEE